MRALIVDPAVRTDIARVVSYATEHPVGTMRLIRMRDGDERAIGDDPRHVVVVPNGYRCVFSVEEQPPGRCRHLSVSVTGVGNWPSVASMALLLGAFGFSHDVIELIDCVGQGKTSNKSPVRGKLYLENHVEAVNVVELI